MDTNVLGSFARLGGQKKFSFRPLSTNQRSASKWMVETRYGLGVYILYSLNYVGVDLPRVLPFLP